MPHYRECGTDACAVVLQRRADRINVARTDAGSEAIVCRQQAGSLSQLLGVLVQQTPPDPLTHYQFLCNLSSCVPVNAQLNHAEHGSLHQQQQAQRQRCDAR